MNNLFLIDNKLTLNDIDLIISTGVSVQLSDAARNRVKKCRQYLEKKISEGGTHYGINTGFGSLCNTRIADDELGKLQTNLIISHACGMGETVPDDIVRIMLLLKIQSLALGYSGIKEDTLDLLIAIYNNQLIPRVYTIGSLGASGDLAPLAHLSLPLIGLGELKEAGTDVWRPSAELMSEKGLRPIQPGAKEGLALLNGTQFMGAYGTYALLSARRLEKAALHIAALSVEAYNGREDAFFSGIQAVRPHSGQNETARIMRERLEGSKIMAQSDKEVQDPYSFRCVPQVHGASSDALKYAESVFETEHASVTDNPLIFPEEDKIVSGGNFHGQPLALTMDFMALAISEIGSISERRIYRMLAGKRGLPPFLAENPGLNSGFMIVQYTAASIVSRNKLLCNPASADSLESSNGQEDHVSMGANAAVKLFEVIQNVQRLLGLELFTSAQALDFRGAENASPLNTKLHEDFRTIVPYGSEDKYMHPLMEKAFRFVQTYRG
jgi:histidine ammonia-lyase